jgi:hypothetical protein
MLSAPGDATRAGILAASGKGRGRMREGGEDFLRQLGVDSPSGLQSFAADVGVDVMNLLPLLGAGLGLAKLSKAKKANLLRKQAIESGAVPGELAGSLLKDAQGEPLLTMVPEHLRAGNQIPMPLDDASDWVPAYMQSKNPMVSGQLLTKDESLALAKNTVGETPKGGVEEALSNYDDLYRDSMRGYEDAFDNLDAASRWRVGEAWQSMGGDAGMDPAEDMLRADLLQRYDDARLAGQMNPITQLERGDATSIDLEDLVRRFQGDEVDISDIVPEQWMNANANEASNVVDSSFDTGASQVRPAFHTLRDMAQPNNINPPMGRGNMPAASVVPPGGVSPVRHQDLWQHQTGAPMDQALSNAGYDAMIGGASPEGMPYAMPIAPPAAQQTGQQMLEGQADLEGLMQMMKRRANASRLYESGRGAGGIQENLAQAGANQHMRLMGASPEEMAGGPRQFFHNLRQQQHSQHEALLSDIQRLAADLRQQAPLRAFRPEIAGTRAPEVPVSQSDELRQMLMALLGYKSLEQGTAQ